MVKFNIIQFVIQKSLEENIDVVVKHRQQVRMQKTY
jgi:hypothetical protein